VRLKRGEVPQNDLISSPRVGNTDSICWEFRRSQQPIPRNLLNSHDGCQRAFEGLAEASPAGGQSMAGENWTMWLNITNFALGLVTLVALLVVFLAVGWDLMASKVKHARAGIDLRNIDAELQAMLHGSHSLAVPGLGLTMADGGEKLEPPKDEASTKKSQE
jgi:hypothetical protein